MSITILRTSRSKASAFQQLMESYMEVLFEKKNGIAVATINRVKDHNALNTAVLKRPDEIFISLDSDDAVRVFIITGTGQKAFVAGADVKEIKGAGQGRPALIKRGQEILQSSDCGSEWICLGRWLRIGDGL
jgi:enoyl-CoA hydratase